MDYSRKIRPDFPLYFPSFIRKHFISISRCRNNLKFYTNPADIQIDGVSDSLRKRGLWAPGETSLLMKILSPGQTFIDIGANLGYFTALGGSLVGPTGKVFSFEPDHINFHFLETNVGLNFPKAKNIRLARKAISDSQGRSTLYHSEHNKGDHRLTPIEEGFSSTESIEHVSLDSFLKSEKIDVIKSDTQGFEGQVMRGAEQVLTNNQKIKLILEFWPYGLKRSGTNPKKFLQYLFQLGFRIFIVDDKTSNITELIEKNSADFLKKISPHQGFTTIYCQRGRFLMHSK